MDTYTALPNVQLIFAAAFGQRVRMAKNTRKHSVLVYTFLPMLSV